MDKRADGFGQTLRNALKDKRLIGAGLAGLAGGAAGAFGLPDLIYKKPTKGSRIGLGVSTGLASALVTLAAMNGKAKDSNLAQDTADLLHNIPTILRRDTVPELKQMSGLTRFMKGYGIEGHPWTQYLNPIRLLKGGFGDLSGFGKSQRQKKLQQDGSLPQSDDPNWVLSSGKSVLNMLLAGAGGYSHAKHILERFRNRQYASRILDFYKGNRTPFHTALSVDAAGRQLLTKLRQLQGISNNGKADFVNTLNAKFKNMPLSGKAGQLLTRLANTGVGRRIMQRLNSFGFGLPSINPNLVGQKLIQDIASHSSIQAPGSTLREPIQKLLQKPKMSAGRKWWTGARTAGRSALILSALGLIQEGLPPFSANRTMRIDRSRKWNLE